MSFTQFYRALPSSPEVRNQLRDEWWKAVFVESPEAQVICGRGGNIDDFNKAAACWLADGRGFDPENAIFRLFSGSTAERLQDLFARREPGTLNGVSLLLAGQLSTVVNVSVVPLGGDHSLVTLSDAGRLWRIESHAQRLTAAIDSSEDIVFLTDAEFRISYANPAMESKTGFTLEEILGQKLDAFRSPGFEDKVRESIQRLEAGETWKGDMDNIRRDGTAFPVEVMMSPIYGTKGEFIGAVSFERDLTVTRRLLSSLQREHQLTLSIINSLDSGVYAVDTSLRLTDFNESWQKLPPDHGYLRFDQPPKIGDELLKFVPDECQREELESLFRAVLSGGDLREFAQSLGPRKRFFVRIVPWRLDGESRGLVYIVTDQSRFHELESLLQQSQKMETIGALAAGVAHDFNNLLQAIKGNISVINLEADLPGKVRSRIDQIEDAASQAADITQQLLSFSRISDEQETVIDFNGIIGDVSEMARKLLKNKVTIAIHPTEHPVMARINGVRAKQMVLNLCINAHDAMPNGGQIIVSNAVVALKPDQVQRLPAGSRIDVPFLRCSIADTGTGIPPEVLLRIFEPFFTTKGPGKGTGLGLAIVHNIINQSGGFLDVESEVGKGTTFSIFLPVVDSGPVAPTQKKVSKSLKGTGTILVVDDLELVIDFASTFLTAVGYDVLTARSPKEALEVIAATGKKIDLLLTDFNMGEQTGEELMREVVRISPSTKLVLASGYLEAPEQERLKAEFDVEILAKPYNIRDAAELISRLLGRTQG